MNIPQGAVQMQEPNVTFQTDHSALTSLTRKKQISNQRLAHWVTTMSEFEYVVEYCPGDSKTLDTADCLSRLIKMPSEMTPERQSESARWQYANCWTEVYSKLFDRLMDIFCNYRVLTQNAAITVHTVGQSVPGNSVLHASSQAISRGSHPFHANCWGRPSIIIIISATRCTGGLSPETF